MKDLVERPDEVVKSVDLDGYIEGTYTLLYGHMLIINSRYIPLRVGEIETRDVMGNLSRQYLKRIVHQLGNEVLSDLMKYYKYYQRIPSDED